MPRKQKQYHYLYKTTNLINNKFYVGMHSTDDLNDGYLGSGKYLRRSINKHGAENFKIEFLEFFENRVDLKESEKNYVNENFIENPLCMNLKIGGEGGFNKEDQIKGRLAVNKILLNRLKTDSNYRNKFCENVSIGIQAYFKNGGKGSFSNKKHSNKTKNKMKLSHEEKHNGYKNSQYGTCWIHNGKENKKIKLDKLNLWTENGWTKGRKMKML